jgi:CheY-like chemotaxis protein
VPLKILFADDSATAQSMGMKILTEAGYEVVSVSNGSAALKKIAEQKPDIAILDVYMPGYNGLEVCEKMRSSIATLNTPVLLTVGKMEAYRNEDTGRVKADGVIVKPFEASDLLAIVKKLEERIFQPSPAQPSSSLAEHTLYLERPTLLTEQLPREDFSVDAAQGTEPPPPARQNSELEIPDHMASTPVFNDTTAHDFSGLRVAGTGPETGLAEPPQSESAAMLPEPVPLAAWKWEPELPAQPEAAGDAPAESIPREASPRETQIMPAYREPEVGNQQGVVMDSAPEELAVPPHPADPTPAAETSAQSVSESATSAVPVVFLQEHMAIHDGLDPALVTDRSQMTEFATRFGVDKPEEVPVGVYAEQSSPEAPAAETEQAHTADSPVAEAATADVSAEDFEARVAAAMTAYDDDEPQAQPDAAPEVQTLPKAEGAPQPEAQAPVQEISHLNALANPMPESQAATTPPETAVAEPPTERAVASPEMQTYGDAVSAYSAADLPVSAPVAAAGMVADPEVIAQVVNRVLERLKPELIAEIVRELNSNK